MIEEGLKYGKRFIWGFVLLIIVILIIGKIVHEDPVEVRLTIREAVEIATEIAEIERKFDRLDRVIAVEGLLNAIMAVESDGNLGAISDNGAAVGPYQLHQIYVDDVERIVGGDIRLSPNISRAYAVVYLNHYATHERLGRIPTLEDMARIHNGGPDGYKKESTKDYWLKVKARLDDRRE